MGFCSEICTRHVDFALKSALDMPILLTTLSKAIPQRKHCLDGDSAVFGALSPTVKCRKTDPNKVLDQIKSLDPNDDERTMLSKKISWILRHRTFTSLILRDLSCRAWKRPKGTLQKGTLRIYWILHLNFLNPQNLTRILLEFHWKKV